MQVEKFYRAQDLRKEILELQNILSAMDKPFELKILEKLNIDVQKQLGGKVVDVMKRELAKLIKVKEKEFIDL